MPASSVNESGASWPGCWRTWPSMCGPPGRWLYGGMLSAIWMWSRMSPSDSGAVSCSAIASAPDTSSAARRGGQLVGRQEVEVLADGAGGWRRGGDDSVDLGVGSREERLVDDARNDEVPALSELPQLRVSQHERYRQPSAVGLPAQLVRRRRATRGSARSSAAASSSSRSRSMTARTSSSVSSRRATSVVPGCRGERDRTGRCLYRLGVRERAEGGARAPRSATSPGPSSLA